MSYDIEVNQGADFSLLVNLQDSKGVELDLTGATFEGKIRPTPQGTTPVYDFTFELLDQVDNTGSFIIKLDDTITSTMVLTPSNTLSKTPTKYAYDVFYTIGTETKLVLEGVLLLRPAVTR